MDRFADLSAHLDSQKKRKVSETLNIVRYNANQQLQYKRVWFDGTLWLMHRPNFFSMYKFYILKARGVT